MPFRSENTGTFELPAKFGVGKSKLGVPEPIYPEIKGRWLNFFFLIFEVAKLIFFLDLSSVSC